MKNISIFSLGIAITLLFAFNYKSNDEKDLSLGRVTRMSGKYIFINCEPTNDYEVVYEVKTVLLGGVTSTNAMVDAVLVNAKKMEKKDPKPYDALIIGSNKYDLAIKFKD
jgi:hypothetical protein